MKKILLVFGTRPEAIKMAPLVHALRAETGRFEPVVCVTAQHRKMLDQVLRTFDVRPDIDLDLMRPGQDLYDLTARILVGLRDVLRSVRPDALLVHGDTTTALAASMAAFYADVPVGHVEAGLRTLDLRAPFPEEFNRQVISRVARWHFAPTAVARDNLRREGIQEASIIVTGNTVVDALLWAVQRLEADPGLRHAVDDALARVLPFDWVRQRFVLITGHRRENFGQGFVEICEALRSLAIRYPAFRFIYPVHLNPQVQAPVRSILADLPNVHLIEPLEYQPFLTLLRHCHLVLTDSGGIQEEAPSLGKPVLVMRDVTERPEGVQAGTVRVVGADRHRIADHVIDLIEHPEKYERMARAHNPYGDGKACARIVRALEA